MHLNEIIGHFQGVKKIGENSYQTRCPAHRDDKASLTITEENDKILMHCHAGCDVKDILSSAGLSEKDLFNTQVQKNEKPKIIAEYIYRDEENKPLYKVVKFEPKNFMQAKYENEKWVWKMKDVRYVLYNLANVIKADTVFFVEGEKDADNLIHLGLTATTTVSGAASFGKRAKEYCESLKGKQVYIIPDNDKAGYGYATDIENALIGIAKETKVLKLVEYVSDLKEKEDISDVMLRYGKEKTLNLIQKMCDESKRSTPESEIEITEANVLSVGMFKTLYKYEINPKDFEKYNDLYNNAKRFCTKHRITGFDKQYSMYKETLVNGKGSGNKSLIAFPDLEETPYKSNRYQMTEDGFIFEETSNGSQVLVCYHPIVPVEKYRNIEDGTEKIKIAFYKDKEWKYMTLEKSVISSNQSIVKLSDLGISVTSENAKYLVKYLAEMENLNKDKIKTNISTSKLGWIGDKVLIPYSNEYEFDNDKDIPNIKEKFGEKGKLEDWVEFFKERRKYNPISQTILAASVVSILLKRIKQNGFTLHVWGTSEYGKTVACMVGQSIYGNPDLGKGIGINFNFTPAGLEYRLSAYNDIPLFINEMQHQKDAKDYDKILFLIAEGKGKSRSTKTGGIARENYWNNVVITNGEKNIIKSNSNAGAYNRCMSFEIKSHSYENLTEVADFVKENYGTVIKELLKHIDEYDCKALFKSYLEELEDIDTTNKQKIMVAELMLGDKILTDIIFKDQYYLTKEFLQGYLISKSQIAVEERALELVKDWYVSERRHFYERYEDEDNRVELYGRLMQDGYVAFIPSILRDKLNNNGFDYNEVLNAWKRKQYLRAEKDRNTKTVRFGTSKVKCVVLDLKIDLKANEEVEMEEPLF